MKQKILFATDYSDASRFALTYAVSLARQWGATLLVAHVAPREQSAGELSPAGSCPSDAELDELRAVAPSDPRIACEHRLLHGEAAEEIVKLADQEKAEFIVLATHGRSWMSHLLAGSVVEGVMRRAHVPVITYHPPSPVAQEV